MSDFNVIVKKEVDNAIKRMLQHLEEISGVSSVLRDNPYANWTVDEWLKIGDIHEDRINEFPNAKKAAELKKTKLYKALK